MYLVICGSWAVGPFKNANNLKALLSYITYIAKGDVPSKKLYSRRCRRSRRRGNEGSYHYQARNYCPHWRWRARRGSGDEWAAVELVDCEWRRRGC